MMSSHRAGLRKEAREILCGFCRGPLAGQGYPATTTRPVGEATIVLFFCPHCGAMVGATQALGAGDL
jgi:hypothetical protein